ncbi:Uncharacterised protein [Mycobacteroides abscessus subsp. abscessus]|nr:Uncharacterised protein [Mycobacteroides abscessus subsp. abscessus]
MIFADSVRAFASVCSYSISSASRFSFVSASSDSYLPRISAACCSAIDTISAASAWASARTSEASSDASRSMREMRSDMPSAVVGGTDPARPPAARQGYGPAPQRHRGRWP